MTIDILKTLCAGEVICNIGQLTVADKRKLDKWTKAGTVVKWRGYWFPIAGAPEGIGPLKICYALPPVAEWAKNSAPHARNIWEMLTKVRNNTGE